MKNGLLHINAWTTTVFFGAILSETVILYPNIFHDAPESLSQAVKFLKIIGPGDFFPKAGLIVLFISLLTILAFRKQRRILNYLIFSFLLLVLFEFLFSVFFFWPRNTIMFVEGEKVHSAEVLKKVAKEFQLGHLVRLIVSGIASGIAFIALQQIKERGVNPAADSTALATANNMVKPTK